MCIYQHSKWPDFEWSNDKLELPLLSTVRHKQGRLLGKWKILDFR